MAKTATAAFPQSPAHVARDVREQGRGARQNNSYRNASIEERTAVLETRWEETVPTLATSRDISDLRGEMGEMGGDLRSEMRNLENRLIKWMIGAGLALLAVVVALFTANTARIDKLDAKIDARFDALMAEIRELRK